MNFPVSIKGVLVEAGRVVLLENERDEWELPGGRLEPGEAPETCLLREFAEELGAVVEVARIIDCWLYEVLPQREVVIITYGVKRRDKGTCLSVMNIGALGYSHLTKSKPCRYLKATAVQYVHG